MITDTQDLNQKLATAVLHGDTDAVRKLLAKGADPCYMDKTCTCFSNKEGSVPVLMLAVLRDDVATARLLVEAGADVRARCFSYIHTYCSQVVQRVEAMGNPYREFGIPFFGREMIRACPMEFARSVDMASLFLKHGAEFIEYGIEIFDEHNYYCGREGYEALTEFLLHHKNNSLNSQLIDEIRRGDAEAVRKLLAEGANVNARVTTDPHGSKVILPLEAAIDDRRLELVALLLENGADVHNVSYPLHFGWECNQPSDLADEKYHRCVANIAKLLLEYGADPDDTHYNIDLITPLHQAADCGNIALIDRLLKGGANINSTDDRGRTPLVFSKNKETAMFLMENGGCFLYKERMDSGATLLRDAIDASDLEYARCLLEHGVKARGLDAAIRCGNIEVVKLLLEFGANLNYLAEDFKSPLHIAAERGYTAIVELLLDHGIPINKKDKFQRTALQLATLAGHQETVRFLQARGAN